MKSSKWNDTPSKTSHKCNFKFKEASHWKPSNKQSSHRLTYSCCKKKTVSHQSVKDCQFSPYFCQCNCDQWKKLNSLCHTDIESLTNHESVRSLLYFFDKVRLTSSQAQAFIQYRLFSFFWQTTIYLCDCSSSKKCKYQTEWPPRKKHPLQSDKKYVWRGRDRNSYCCSLSLTSLWFYQQFLCNYFK